MGEFSCLNLDKDEVKKSVILKLNTLGYNVNDDTSISRIKNIIMKIQRDSGLMIDGCIGVRTMSVLGYSWEEIKKMLKIRKRNSSSTYTYPLWLLFQ